MILSPPTHLFDPFHSCKSDVHLDLGISHMFSIESLGLSSIKDIGSIDLVKVREFNDNIVFKSNKYFISLPWLNPEKLCHVPSNHKNAYATVSC